MPRFDLIDIQRMAVSAVGALTLSAACVLGAVAPARAGTVAQDPVSAWVKAVQHRVEQMPPEQNRFVPSELTTADVALHFTADGKFADAGLARSSGDAAIDRRAVRIASSLAYPPLPASARGAGREVILQLHFGQVGDDAILPLPSKRVELADVRQRNVQVAAR